MNCKPGDLAIVTARINKEDNGKVVEVLRLAKHGDTYPDGPFNIYDDGGDTSPAWWVLGRDLHASGAGKVVGALSRTVFADTALTPIRDPGDDAQDETLLWKSVPNPTKETA